MKYIYLVTHHLDYEGYTIVAVKTSKRKALDYAENNLGGDLTVVIRYPVGWDHTGPISFVPKDWIIASWNRIGYGGSLAHSTEKEFERII